MPFTIATLITAGPLIWFLNLVSFQACQKWKLRKVGIRRWPGAQKQFIILFKVNTSGLILLLTYLIFGKKKWRRCALSNHNSTTLKTMSRRRLFPILAL